MLGAAGGRRWDLAAGGARQEVDLVQGGARQGGSGGPREGEEGRKN